MMIVRVELHSANDGSVRELARLTIDNIGGHQGDAVADYRVRTWRGRTKEALDRSMHFTPPNRLGEVKHHRRKDLHVWHLIAKALRAVGYGEN